MLFRFVCPVLLFVCNSVLFCPVLLSLLVFYCGHFLVCDGGWGLAITRKVRSILGATPSPLLLPQGFKSSRLQSDTVHTQTPPTPDGICSRQRCVVALPVQTTLLSGCVRVASRSEAERTLSATRTPLLLVTCRPEVPGCISPGRCNVIGLVWEAPPPFLGSGPGHREECRCCSR